MAFTCVEGDHLTPVIVHVPHSSRVIGAVERARLAVTDAQLIAELDEITDTGTDVIAELACDQAVQRPWMFRNDLSRLVVDPERFPDAREELAAVGRGAVYTRLAGGGVLRDGSTTWSTAETARLMDAHYWPYAEAMTQLTRERLAACGRAVIVDVHSYPVEAGKYEKYPHGPRPQVCLGVDVVHTPSRLLDAAAGFFRDAGFEVDVNTPFTGCYVPLPLYGDERVEGIMVEIRKDTYLDGLVPTDAQQRLGALLATLIDEATA